MVEYETAPNCIKEIGRLREITFRKVGEGTGERIDLDEYDKYYKHIVLWDDAELSIMGSYRLGICHEIIDNHGLSGLYNASLFNFSAQFIQILYNAVELGRSFIQQKYWRSTALDTLWQGIGSYLTLKTSVRYLYGAVSISDNYSESAKNLIVHYYKKWYGTQIDLAVSKNRYHISKNIEIEIEQLLTGENRESDINQLKATLKELGYSIPVLFRRYVDLCEPQGVKFLDFGVDRSFSNCVDGLILLDLSLLKPKFKERYFGIKSEMKENQLQY